MKWHDCANNLINQKNKVVYWSYTVENDFNEKFKEFYEFIKLFLDSMSDLIEDFEDVPINYYSFEDFILKNTRKFKLDKFKKVKIIELFWKNYYGNFNTPSELEYKFIVFHKNYLKTNKTRKKYYNILLTHIIVD